LEDCVGQKGSFSNTMLSDAEIHRIRSRFPVFERQVHLCSCTKGALSDVVEAGLQEFIRLWHQNGIPWKIWMEKYEAIRHSFAKFIGAKPEEIAVIYSTSQGISEIASALRFDKRKKVVMGELDFPASGHIWLTQKLRGAEVTFLDSVDNCVPVESYARAVDGNTIIVPVAHVSYKNGARADLDGIIRVAHDNGAYVIVDGYQVCGTEPVDVHALNADFYVTGTLKYLLGSPGLAFLYVKESLIESFRPTVTGAFAQRILFQDSLKNFEPASTARRYEMGTPAMPSIYGSAAALDLLTEIGLENVAAHITNLRNALGEGLRALQIVIKTPLENAGPMIVIKAKDAEVLAGKLAERNIIASAKFDGLRIAFHVYNTLDDVRAILEGLEENLDLVTVEHERSVTSGARN
jgi:selenocysteine lyase/cysteine desulfurase